MVPLPKGAESRLSAALAIPRVGLIGIMEGAPHASPLLDQARNHVRVVEVPWLKEAVAGEYLPLKIAATESRAPPGTKGGGDTKMTDATEES